MQLQVDVSSQLPTAALHTVPHAVVIILPRHLTLARMLCMPAVQSVSFVCKAQSCALVSMTSDVIAADFDLWANLHVK